eukprot:6979000-Heterocapsa_arctica.AAC.1
MVQRLPQAHRVGIGSRLGGTGRKSSALPEAQTASQPLAHQPMERRDVAPLAARVPRQKDPSSPQAGRGG